MEYYTQKNKLKLTEYGRNIQQMVEHALTIEDRAERQRCVNTIINVMGNLFPHLRDVNDFKHKLWDHLAMMSDYKLDIDYPYDVPQQRQETKPDKIPYPEAITKDRHYGRNMAQFARAAAEYQGDDKLKFITILANQAKKSFLQFNNETASDAKILADLRRLSGGTLEFNDEDIKLKDSRELLNTAPAKPNYKPYQKQYKHYNKGARG